MDPVRKKSKMLLLPQGIVQVKGFVEIRRFLKIS